MAQRDVRVEDEVHRVDSTVRLEETLDFHELSTAADDLMDHGTVVEQHASTPEDARLRRMMTETARQALIADAGWDIYQRPQTDRKRRRENVALAMQHVHEEAAHEQMLSTLAKKGGGKNKSSAAHSDAPDELLVNTM